MGVVGTRKISDDAQNENLAPSLKSSETLALAAAPTPVTKTPSVNPWFKSSNDGVEAVKQKPANTTNSQIVTKPDESTKIVTDSSDEWPALDANNAQSGPQDSDITNSIKTHRNVASALDINSNGIRYQKVPKNNWKKLDIDIDYNHRSFRRTKTDRKNHVNGGINSAEVDKHRNEKHSYCYFDKVSNGYYYQYSGRQGWIKATENVQSIITKNSSTEMTNLKNEKHVAESIRSRNNASVTGKFKPKIRHEQMQPRQCHRNPLTSEIASNRYSGNSGYHTFQGKQSRRHLPGWDECANVSKDKIFDYMGMRDQKYAELINASQTYGLISSHSFNVGANDLPPLFSIRTSSANSLLPKGQVQTSQDSASVVKAEKEPSRSESADSLLTTSIPTTPTPLSSPNSDHNVEAVPTYEIPHGLPSEDMMFPAFPSQVLHYMQSPNANINVLEQIEYYFSEENLNADFFLRRNMDSDGYVSISLIASFSRVRVFTHDFNVIIGCINASENAEMHESMLKVRPKLNPHTWPITSS